MWSSWRGAGRVTCIACGTSLSRTEAREYDKYGDRWERSDKEFEYLCKPCHRELCRHPRGDLESLLVESDAGERDRTAFLSGYLALLEERYGSVEPGRADRDSRE